MALHTYIGWASRAACVALLLCAAASQAALLGLYPFDSNGNDISGNNRHATLVEATVTPDGYEGQAYAFAGAQRMRLPVDIRTSVAPRVTYGCWVWLDALTSIQTFLSNDDFHFFGRTLNVDFRGSNWPSYSMYGNSGVYGSGLLHQGRWVFVAVRHDNAAGIGALTVDGLSFVTAPFTTPSGAATLDVGAHPAHGNYVKGRIDNVFVFDEFLTDLHLETIRTRGIAGALAVAAGSVDGSVNLKTTLSAPAQVRTGDLFEYRLRVQNAGPASTALAVTARATLPPANRAELAALPAGCTTHGGELVCALGSVGAGQASALLKLPFIARSDGPVPLTVTASTLSWETDASDDFASAEATVSDAAAAAGLRVVVPVVNASFESPALADGTATADHGLLYAVPGWLNQNPDSGIRNPSGAQTTGGQVPDGINALWTFEPGPVTQVLPTVLRRGLKYTLTVAVGRMQSGAYGGYRIELWAGSQMLAAQQSAVSPPAGGFVDARLSYTLRKRHAMEGHPLEVRLLRASSGSGYSLYDRVRLEARAATN